MLKLTFKSVNNQPYFPSVRNSFLEIHEASAVKKIKKIVQLIIFLPWLIIKDCSRLLYRKKAKQVSIVGELYSAVNLTRSKMLRAFDKSKNFVSKHKSEIIKATLVGGAFLVAGRQLMGKQSNQTHLLDRFSNQAAGTVGFILGCASFALFKNIKKLSEMKMLKSQPVYEKITKADQIVKLVLDFNEIQRKLKSINKKSNTETHIEPKDCSYYKNQNKASLELIHKRNIELIDKALNGINQLLDSLELSDSAIGYLYSKTRKYLSIRKALTTDYNVTSAVINR